MIKVRIPRPDEVHSGGELWSRHIRSEYMSWCHRNIGIGNVLQHLGTRLEEELVKVYFIMGNDWCCNIWYGCADFFFRKPEDATLFKLRWA